MLKAGTLTHGGIMVNYQCNAACRHCLYSCSPTRSSGYVNEQTAENICWLLRKGGCRSVHIGGGEPFLDFEGLVMMIRALQRADISLEYIETNAYWSLQDSGREKLERLLSEGAQTLCISIDPYHAEYIPYGAPVALAELCEKTGMNYFLWKQEFLPALSRLDSKKTHSRQEMETALSATYIHNTARRYGITYGGRAINIEKESTVLYPAEHFTADNTPCPNLLSTGHFHVDMDCCFIPPRCTGIKIPLSETVNGIPAGKYPAFEALYHGGVSALLEIARQHGFSPQNSSYSSKCSLCFYLRRFLSEKDFPELDKNHYEESLKYSWNGSDA
jgi:hypothetical protein